MSDSSTWPVDQQNLQPVPRKRRRITPCSNCRHRKVKCITSEQPPVNPCQRCAKKNLDCEYNVHASASAPTLPLPYTGPPPAGSRPRYYGQPLPPLTGGTSLNPQPSSPLELDGLPYTGPPPPGHLPRYYGQTLPDLSVSDAGTRLDVNHRPQTTLPSPIPSGPYGNAEGQFDERHHWPGTLGGYEGEEGYADECSFYMQPDDAQN
ncbi:hypothetical protein FB45DRAFT_864413 [Roridomyces roridus]|uniref:Zn(2)-C6 fungal-type domain-containing protein n=1 Tax=Roridomyces roridus TaxID=1738132 RepID=A0AAD7C1C8_9AGAR|nr:hypothetical protein FB45DRAFT_864413 [Roridomyces roridus]